MIGIDEFIRTHVKGARAFILRGVPGSGKSTLAKAIQARDGHGIVLPKEHIFSADNYRMVNGNYVFNPKDNGLVHAACLRGFVDALTEWCLGGPKVLVCDNTNTTIQEIAPYAAVARAFDYTPYVVTVWADPGVAATRNTHNVPRATVMKMHHRLVSTDSQLPKDWNPIDVENI